MHVESITANFKGLTYLGNKKEKRAFWFSCPHRSFEDRTLHFSLFTSSHEPGNNQVGSEINTSISIYHRINLDHVDLSKLVYNTSDILKNILLKVIDWSYQMHKKVINCMKNHGDYKVCLSEVKCTFANTRVNINIHVTYFVPLNDSLAFP